RAAGPGVRSAITTRATTKRTGVSHTSATRNAAVAHAVSAASRTIARTSLLPASAGAAAVHGAGLAATLLPTLLLARPGLTVGGRGPASCAAILFCPGPIGVGRTTAMLAIVLPIAVAPATGL